MAITYGINLTRCDSSFLPTNILAFGFQKLLLDTSGLISYNKFISLEKEMPYENCNV